MGIDVPDLQHARQAAISLLANADRASSASQYPVEKVMIRDEGGREVMILDAKDARCK